MKRLSLSEGLGLALIFALCSMPMRWLLAPFFPYHGLQATLVALTILYIWFLIAKRENKVGRLLMGLGTTAIGAGILVAADSLAAATLGCSALIWAARSLLHYRSFIPIGCDAFVVLFASCLLMYSNAAVGFTAFSVWVYFLVQAVSTWIPQRFGSQLSRASTSDPFDKAYEAADCALTKLIQRSI
jgi:hypothetical protein